MHILATFATLCCQTRWPRNHSCTTQEHVSFFRTFSGHFRKSRLFRHFGKKRSNLQIPSKMRKKENLHARTFAKLFSQTRNLSKTFSLDEKFLHTIAKHKCTNLQMCKNRLCTKCANLQRTLFCKCNFLHSAQFCKCTFHILTNSQFTLDTILQMQISFCVV